LFAYYEKFWLRNVRALTAFSAAAVEPLDAEGLVRVEPDRAQDRGALARGFGNGHTRGSTLLPEELAEQALGGLLVAPALDENIENEAILVDGTPEPNASSRRR
jgi:hypothetical protein